MTIWRSEHLRLHPTHMPSDTECGCGARLPMHEEVADVQA